MAPIPEHLIDRIRDSVDIVDLISRYISLKKRGRNFIAHCPFHTEKTPSFTVSSEKQIFYCFGCGAGGNVFNFLMRYEKITFIEAVNKLAEEAGIQLPRYQAEEKAASEYDRLYKANHLAAEYFHTTLKQHFNEIKKYLAKRGISQDSIDFFKIGYVPDSWDGLYNTIQSKKISLESFLQAGLIMQSEKDPNRKYDRFRNRLIFPIYNVSGRVIAFGGRALSDDPQTPKYLNSPESPIYKKSQILYGLNYSKDWIRQEGYAIFVEGYMDYLQLFQNNVKNVVATSGTALTTDHAKIIRRYSADIVMCYDADNAGINAALRGGQILFENNLNVRVLILPENEDPDSYVKNNGSSAFYALIKSARDFFEFKSDYLGKARGLDTVAKRSGIVSEMLETLASHPDPLKQNFYIKYLSDKFGLQENTLLEEMQKKQRTLRSRERNFSERQPSVTSQTRPKIPLTGAWSAEKDVIVLLLTHFQDLKAIIFSLLEPEDFLNEAFRNIFVHIRNDLRNSGESPVHTVISSIEEKEGNEEIVSLITADLLKDIQNPGRYLNDCIERIKITRFQTRIDYLRQTLKQTTPENPEFNKILQEEPLNRSYYFIECLFEGNRTEFF
ncbi:MAG: DNA primase [Calditrichia bacterium]